MVRIGKPARSVYDRRRAARSVLTASAPPALITNYDVGHGTMAEKRFLELAMQAGHSELSGDQWPVENTELGDVPRSIFRDGNAVVVATPDGTLALVTLSWGWLSVRVAAGSADGAARLNEAFRAAYPASYLIIPDGDVRVPITFWTHGRFGPEPRLRKIDSASWADIEGNYTAEVRSELGELSAWSRPERDGQLILWQGPPGTGKTWALRALATEWASWAEFHYITDPDAFFVTEPSYMINVLLSDSYAAIDLPTGDVYMEGDPEAKWRVLILEDTGELLAATAKKSYGQGLSRLLNVVDGMIGQGLRVLALVTTNDELGSLHPAVARPGRCASQLTFGALNAEEASEFLGETVQEGGTLAELYALRSKGEEALPEQVESMTAAIEERQMAEAFDDLLVLARSPLPDVTPEDRARYRHPA